MIPKFRLFDKDLRLMLEVHVIDFYERTIDCYADDLGVNRQEVYSYEMDEDNYLLMQSTGLHDVNGKEIYEGDVVEINTLPEIGVVKFDETHCRFTINLEILMSVPIFKELAERDIKIIGNIHENSDLIKGEN